MKPVNSDPQQLHSSSRAQQSPIADSSQPVDPAVELSSSHWAALSEGVHHDPHSFYGVHQENTRIVVRTYRPNATSVAIDFGDTVVEAEHVGQGLYVADLSAAGVVPQESEKPSVADVTAYEFVVTCPSGRSQRIADPYRFLPTLGEVDMHLLGEGRHERLWTVLGAKKREFSSPRGAVVGTSFAVWAPNARGVSVIGDFCGWDASICPMRCLGSTGVWEVFVPGVEDGACYKYCVRGADGRTIDKADPCAQFTEVPPATASRVFSPSYHWSDQHWLQRRAQLSMDREPMSIYEVHIGSWKPGLSYRELATELSNYVQDNGFTHVEFLPVAEHPFGGSWGYQVSSYFAPSSRFGNPDDFRYLVDHLHNDGIGVLVDWVPAHFPKDEFSLGRFDGTALYEHADPRRGEQLDWGTFVFDFGRHEVRNFLVANALYWCEEFHIDGLRVDAVASMLYLDYSRPEGGWEPNIHGGRENLEAISFLQEVNATVEREHPGVLMVAEESTSWPGVTSSTTTGGLGFDRKWNMGWMNDTLVYAGRDPMHRQHHHNDITFSMVYAWSERFLLPLSHDEVVHGKGSMWTRMPGDSWKKAAGLRALYGYMWAHPGKKLLFMGLEFGQVAEWSEDNGLVWDDLTGWEGEYHRGIADTVRDLNRIYTRSPALYRLDDSPDGFEWIDANDAEKNVVSFIRKDGDGNLIACISNFSGVAHEGYRIGLPLAGHWDEILNTDAEHYEGSGVGNLGVVTAETSPWHGKAASALMTVPPLATVWLQWRG